LKVLIVIADDYTTKEISENLKDPIINIKKINSIFDCIETIKKQKINLVVIDEQILKTDTCFCLKEIRKFSNVPIIIISNRSDTESVIKTFEYGVNDYVISHLVQKN